MLTRWKWQEDTFEKRESGSEKGSDDDVMIYVEGSIHRVGIMISDWWHGRPRLTSDWKHETEDIMKDVERHKYRCDKHAEWLMAPM